MNKFAALTACLTLAACGNASPVFAGSVVTNSYTTEHGRTQSRTVGASQTLEVRNQQSASAAYKNEFITPEGTNGYVEYRGLGSASIGMSGQPEVSCSGSLVARVDPAFMCAVSSERTQTHSITQGHSSFETQYDGTSTGRSHSVSADNF